MNYNDIISEKVKEVASHARSQWKRGVCHYAHLIIERANEEPVQLLSIANVEEVASCGAGSLQKASWGGSYYCYNLDIATLLCTPSELKRKGYGMYEPNKSEEWLDVQSRALYQACELIKDILRGLICQDMANV